MSKAKTTTGKAELAVLDANNVPSIIGALEAKIKSLDHITGSKYKTTGKLNGFNNIHEETNVGNLIKAFSFVSNKGKAYVAAAEEMGLDSFPVFKESDSDVSDWKEDIMLRIAIINHKETLDKLNSYKEKFQKFLSEEDQKHMLLSEMAEFLGTGK